MLSHQSGVSNESLKFTESHVIHLKVTHHFDSALPNSFDSLTYFLPDIGRLCTFAKMHDPQGKCMLLHEIGDYLPNAVQ